MAGAITTAFNLSTAALGWYNYLKTHSQNLTLTLGPTKGQPALTFYEFEIPERFGDLAGRHEVALHEFPGGSRTLQAMGPFPGPLEWSGVLIGSVDGKSPFERALIMDNFRVQGMKLYLNYGGLWEWSGILKSWKAQVRHQNYITYKAVFEPDLDITESNNQTSLNQAALQAQTPEGLLSYLQSYLSSIATSVLPASIVTTLESYSTLISNLLLPASGLIAAVAPNDAASIVSQGASIVSLLLPYKTTSAAGSLGAAASAAAIIPAVKSISNLFNGLVTTNSVKVRTINPNLPRLASQYYNDPSQWPKIAAANGTLDPQQIGIQVVTIPGPLTS